MKICVCARDALLTTVLVCVQFAPPTNIIMPVANVELTDVPSN